MYGSATAPIRRVVATLATSLVVAASALALGTTTANAAEAVSTPAAASAAQHGEHDSVVNPGAPALRSATRVSTAQPATLARVSAAPTATYDVHVLALDTAAGPHGTTETESRQMIAKMASDYATQTGGAISFRFADFAVLPATTAVGCHVADLEARYAKRLAALGTSSGATDSTWVIVTAEDSRCGYAAEGFLGSAGVHMNGHWGAWGAGSTITSVHVMPLAHELTHNLGLHHAAKATGVNPFSLPFTYSEYGDDSSLMGSSSGIKLTAADRSALGVLPADQIAVSTGARATETFTLGAFGDDATADLLVVPVAGARAYQVERVAGSGVASLQIRTTDGLLEQLGSVPTGTESVLIAQPGWSNGTVTLPGGITLTVGRVAGSTTQVTVTRALDAMGPSAAGTTLCPSRTVVQGVCRVATGASNYKISLNPHAGGDNVFTASASLVVDGRTITTLRNEVRSGSQARPAFQAAARSTALTLAAGRHTVEVVRTDLAGNTSVQRQSIVVAPVRAKLPARLMWLDAVATKKNTVVSWIADDFPTVAGAAPKNAFRVKVAKVGGRTTTQVVAASKDAAKLGKLKKGTYKISVCAANTAGCSAARTVTLTVKR